MLSLYPQDHTSNFCHMPYRSIAASTFSDPASFKTYTMGGVVQPPTPQQEQCMDTDDAFYNEPSSPRTRSAQQSPRLSAITLSPPADYSNIDPNKVAEALEIARDSYDGARDPIVSGILESALSQIWDRVMENPESYVMTTGEFAVFNFYQHRFMGNKIAIAARARFWNNTHA
ncbi:hypothetical protein N0V82_007339 [Gnomoniopsis sp. IMI 355080]|nr:hypothetical protein N0V82_007339 [Gnomoniopsis sp. IMI 355080]